MKRLSNLYVKICDLDNLKLADKKASRGKSGQFGVITHNKNKEKNLELLRQQLIDKTFSTSEYEVFKVFEPKERDVYKLPYFPDRILHHAIMNILEPIFISSFTNDSYSCIKGKGIHGAAKNIKKALVDIENTKYCLKLDIKKFYPSIDHEVLKQLLRRKFKDKELLWLLDEIIESSPGVPIGNYLSQFFANFYLSYFDHWIKENKMVKYYFRYADDIVILSKNKEDLHILFKDIKCYIEEMLKLKIKENYQIFPISSRGIDFIGYKFFHTHILLRKRIKKNFIKMLRKNKNSKSIASYNGWLKHCNSKNLVNKLSKMYKFGDFGIQVEKNKFVGEKIKIAKVLNKEIEVYDYEIADSKFYIEKGKGKCLKMQIKVGEEKRVLFTSGTGLISQIEQVEKDKFPFLATIILEDEKYFFS